MPRAWRCHASTGAPRPTAWTPNSSNAPSSAGSAEEDAKRPHRERETLVGEHTTIINRVKATLARLGIRGFNPKLKKAPACLGHLRTPEGEPIPPNTLSELQR